MYLLSDLSSGVSGETHHVDCGYHIVGMKLLTRRTYRSSDPMGDNSFGQLFPLPASAKATARQLAVWLMVCRRA